MAIQFWIPRIEFKIVDFIGDIHNGTPTIDNLDVDVAAFSTGMFVNGPGIPAGAKILSIGTNDITLDMNATADSTQVDVESFKRFDFQFPPSKDTNVSYKPANSVIDSLSGKRQVQTNYIEGLRQLEHWFVNQSDASVLENDFYLNWAALGCSFRYFPDKADSFFLSCSLDKPHGFDKARQIKKHPDFLYKLPMSLRYIVPIPTRAGGNVLTEDGDSITTEDGDNIIL